MENKNHHFSVREVEGYDPSQNLIKLRDYQGRESLYLEVKHRKDWFLRWCYANGKIGMLDDSEITYNPVSKMVEAKATVYVDGQIMARSAAGKPYDPENMSHFSRTVFQDVGTIAIGRALANAGFGTVNCCLEEGDTLTTLADAPVVPPASSSTAAPSASSAPSVASPATKPAPPQQANPENHPLMQLLRQPQQPSATNQNENTRTVSPTPSAGGTAEKQTKEDPADSSSQTAPKTASTTAQSPRTTPGFKKNPDIPLPKTVEEAKQAIMPFGSSRGKTLGEMLAQNVNQIAYYAGRYGNRKFANPAYPNLMKACQMILDAEGGQQCS